MEYKKKPKIRYCGPDIECLDVVSGELLSSVIRKLAEGVCEDCLCDYQYINTLYQAGEVFTGSLTNWASVAPYTSLVHTPTIAGKYKYTLDIGMYEEVENSSALIGLSINNANPVSNFKTEYIISPGYNSKTVHFIADLVVGNTASLKFKAINASVGIDGIKMIIEKIA